MSFESDIIAKYAGLFSDRMWFDTAPEGTPRADLSAPFCIVQQVGGEDSWFIDNSLKDKQRARVQFFVWGERRDEVSLAMRQLRQMIALSITPEWITSPVGAPVADWNEVLDLRGLRCDFEFAYADEFAAEPVEPVYVPAEDAGNINPETMMGGPAYGNAKFSLTEDFAGLWQDSQAISPVTAVGQKVGFMADRQFGLVRGPELVPPAAGLLNSLAPFSAVAGASVVGNGIRIADVAGADGAISVQVTGLLLNEFYEASYNAVEVSGLSGSAASRIRSGGTSGSANWGDMLFAVPVPRTLSGVTRALAATGWFTPHVSQLNAYMVINSLSVRQFYGNHATQLTVAYQPTLVRDSLGRLRLKFAAGQYLNVPAKVA